MNIHNTVLDLLEKHRDKRISKSDLNLSLLSLINQDLKDCYSIKITSGESRTSKVFDEGIMNASTVTFKKLIELLQSLFGESKSDDEIGDALLKTLEAINELELKLKFPHKLVFKIQNNVKDKEGHLIGYAGAEYFIAQNPDWEEKLSEWFRKDSLDVHMLFQGDFLKWLLQNGYFDLLSAQNN